MSGLGETAPEAGFGQLRTPLAATLAFVPAGAQDRELSSRGELLDGVAAVVNDGIVLHLRVTARCEARLGQRRRQLANAGQLLRKRCADH